MCGLLVTVGRDASIEHLRRAAHRGPDGEGWQLYETPDGRPVRFGHRRLSVIDPDPRSDQPMLDEDGQYVIAYNGMIYNFETLRDELTGAGHSFGTASDTEVILEGYKHWGAGVTDHLNGMFAFVILDLKSGELFAARDPFGIKPLYFIQEGANLALASEIKQIYDIWGRNPAINKRAALDFLIDGLTDHSDQTMFEGVQSLSPGGSLHIDVTGGLNLTASAKKHAYSKQPETATIDAFHGELNDAVRRHLRHDASVGFCLSGGLDSGSIVNSASSVADKAIPPVTSLKCVTAGFSGAEIDETEAAASVAGIAGAKHLIVDGSASDMLSVLPEIIYHQDEPFPTASLYAQWIVFARAKEAGLKVMLDGQGADELLFGYHHVFPFRLFDLISRGRLLSAWNFTHSRKKLHGGQAAASDFKSLLGRVKRWAARAWRGPKIRPAPTWINSRAIGTGSAPLNPRAHQFHHGVPTLGRWRKSAINATSLRRLLRFEDRNSMAHGIEARLPFLDRQFSDFCQRQPHDFFFNQAWTKWPMREPSHSNLPESVRRNSSKIGFAAPDFEWLNGPLNKWVINEAQRALVAFPEIFDDICLSKLLEAAGRSSAEINSQDMFALFRIAVFSAWAKRFGLTEIAD